MAGMSSDQTDAAIMMPAARPRKMRCTPGRMLPRNRNTSAEPNAVIRNVNPVPVAAQESEASITSPPCVYFRKPAMILSSASCSVRPSVRSLRICSPAILPMAAS